MPYTESPQHDPIRQWVKADPLMLLGGVTLTCVAGFINTTSLMYFHVPVSHMSGVVSKMSMDLAVHEHQEFINLVYIFGGFFSGSVLSGFILGGRNVQPSRNYARVLALEFTVILSAMAFFRNGMNFGISLVAFACGLQNAMASNYLGLIIRTTHVTGMVTDIGVLVGQALRRKRVKGWKIFFLASLLSGFFLGGFSAIYAHAWVSFYALLFPALLCLAMAARTFWYTQAREGTHRAIP